MVCIICTRIMRGVIQITSVLSLHSINCYARSSDFPAQSVPVVICDVIIIGCIIRLRCDRFPRSQFPTDVFKWRIGVAVVLIRAMEVIVKRRRFSSK